MDFAFNQFDTEFFLIRVANILTGSIQLMVVTSVPISRKVLLLMFLRHGKSFSAKPLEVTCKDLAINQHGVQ